MIKSESIKVITPAVAGTDHNRIPKRPVGCPEQAVPVLNKPTPGDTKGIATLPVDFIKRKE